MNKTIRLCGLPHNDRLVMIRMIELVCAKTHDHWRVTDSADAQVVIIDIDNADFERSIQALSAQARSVITFANRIIQGDYYPLTKPLRTASLLKCLSAVTMAIARSQNDSEYQVRGF